MTGKKEAATATSKVDIGLLASVVDPKERAEAAAAPATAHPSHHLWSTFHNS